MLEFAFKTVVLQMSSLDQPRQQPYLRDWVDLSTQALSPFGDCSPTPSFCACAHTLFPVSELLCGRAGLSPFTETWRTAIVKSG